MAMTPEEKRRLSSLMTTSALSPDYNKEEATAALEAMMREGNQLDLPSKPISTTAGATVDPRAALPGSKQANKMLDFMANKWVIEPAKGTAELAADATIAPIGLLQGKLPLVAKIPLKTVQTVLQKAFPEQAGSPIEASVPDIFDIAKIAYDKVTDDPLGTIAENLPDIIGGGIGLASKAAKISKARKVIKAIEAAKEAKAVEAAKSIESAIPTKAPKSGTTTTVVTTTIKYPDTDAGWQQLKKQAREKLAIARKSGDATALAAAKAESNNILDASVEWINKQETLKSRMFEEKGIDLNAHLDTPAKKKKKGGGGEGEGGAGGDDGGGGPRDDDGGTGSGLSSALLAAERTGPKFTIIQGGGQKVIKPPREVKRNTFDIIDEGEQGIPIRDKPVLDSELEDPDAQEIYDAAYRELTGLSMMTDKPPKPLTVREQRIKDDQFSTMPVFRTPEERRIWNEARQRAAANADAAERIRRTNERIQQDTNTSNLTEEERVRQEQQDILDKINKEIENDRQDSPDDIEAAIRSMPDDMLTGGVERLRREQARKASSSDQRVALYAPGAGGPDTRLPLGPVDDGGMRMSDAPSGRGNRIPDIDPEEVRSAALAAIQLERAAAEAAAELPPSIKLQRALAEKEYEKQFSPERAAEAAKKVESEAFWTSRLDPDAPLGVDEANDIIRTGVKGKIHPFLAEPLAAAENADKGYQLALKDWYETVKVPDPYDPKATTVVEQLLLIDSGLAPVARSQKLKYRRGPDRVEKYVRKNEFGDGSYGRTYSVVDRNGKPKVAKISYHTGANYNQAHKWEKNVARAIQNVTANATPAEKSLYLKHFPKFEQILERPDDPGGYIIVMDELRPMRKDEEIELFKGRKALREKLKEKGFLNAEQTDDLPKQDFVIPYDHNVVARPTYGAMRNVLTADDYNKMSPRVRSFYKALEYMSDVHGIHWGDMHEGNVMIDPKTGNYVASDTGLFRVMPRSHPYYNHTYTKEQAVAEAAGRAARQGDVATLADELSGETERLATANPAEKELFKRARERGLELKAVQDAKREERLREAARQLLIQQGLVRPKGK